MTSAVTSSSPSSSRRLRNHDGNKFRRSRLLNTAIKAPVSFHLLSYKYPTFPSSFPPTSPLQLCPQAVAFHRRSPPSHCHSSSISGEPRTPEPFRPLPSPLTFLARISDAVLHVILQRSILDHRHRPPKLLRQAIAGELGRPRSLRPCRPLHLSATHP